MPDQGPNRKPDQATKDRIIELAREGMTNTVIARDLNVHGHIVNGLVSNARRRGLLPQLPPKHKSETVQMNPPAVAQAQPQAQPQVQPQPQPQQNYMQPAPQSSGPVQDDFTGGRPILGGSGGFNAPAQGVKYTVERMVPPDGLLGTHHGSFSVDELGQIYGEGTYKVTRHEPGRAVPIEFVQKIAASYGPARSNMTGSRSQPPPRPMYGQRPWERGDQDQSGGAPSPMLRSPYGFGRPDPVPQQQDRAIVDFARNQAAAGDAAVTKALEMVGQVQTEAMKQVENARRSGPDTYLVKVLETQQDIASRRWEEEIKREEAKRDAEEKKWERRQADERERWDRERAADKERHDRERSAEKERYERDQAAQKDAHDRELQRIRTESEARLLQIKAETEERSRREKEDRDDRARRDKEEREERERRAADERKWLLELEDKKLKLIRDESDIQQKRLETELQKTREDMKSLQDAAQTEMRETREATKEHIESAQSRAQEQYERDKEQLDREHKLKERALDKEHELNRQIIDTERQIAQSQGGDQIFTTVNTLIKEGSKALEKMVELQKVKAMNPEAQTAYVARGGAADGNVIEQPAKQEPQRQAQPQQQAPQVQPMQEQIDPQAAYRTAQNAAQPTNGNGNGNGHAPMSEAQASGSHMESIIREQMTTPLAQEIIEEWALYVESGSDATTFANLYLEMMRDPRSDEKRQACAAFAAFMKVRKWAKVYKVIRPFLRPETQEILDRPEAEGFYEQFRAMVILQIQDYWDQFVASKLPGQGGAQGAGVPAGPPLPSQPSAQAPVEPQGAIGDNGDAPQAPPVPTRDILRPKQQQ